MKKSSVRVTNSRASRLPSQRGAFAPDPESFPPIRPKLVPKARQLQPGPSVRITNSREPVVADQNFDPLTQHMLAQAEFHEGHAPPDRNPGRAHEIQNLDGLRLPSEGVTIKTDYDGPAPAPSGVVQGGDQRDFGHGQSREVGP